MNKLPIILTAALALSACKKQDTSDRIYSPLHSSQASFVQEKLNTATEDKVMDYDAFVKATGMKRLTTLDLPMYFTVTEEPGIKQTLHDDCIRVEVPCKIGDNLYTKVVGFKRIEDN
jgi:hypothetical protein